MSLECSEKEDLIRRLSNSKEISFVFGSALTGRREGIGILEPLGVVDFIQKKMYDAGYQQPYDDYLKSNSDVLPYQAAFEFVAKNYGADEIYNIINEIVNLNVDPDTGKQKIPKAVKDFVKAIKDKKLKVKYIITTNFDTLIEEALAEENILYNSISIVPDSNINENANDLLTIVHIHGVWNKGDTMHTRNQLNQRRAKIEESIRNILDGHTMCIMAYGGWEDSFTRTLLTIVNNNQLRYSLVWCFYSNNDGAINKNYGHLESGLKEAISRERIQFYKGIDCSSVFDIFNREIIEVKKL
ncbi:SIR2 family protein [Serratia fonticola]|uniref:SIR2 family protein n=1 Tax=Serratia fonticola TaxID=47917 RepID=UPI001377B988|nr:SIR2 family protein [Serratia fonticola]NCG49727.1 SIR2 family protein [Serratia fonticola]